MWHLSHVSHEFAWVCHRYQTAFHNLHPSCIMLTTAIKVYNWRLAHVTLRAMVRQSGPSKLRKTSWKKVTCTLPYCCTDPHHWSADSELLMARKLRTNAQRKKVRDPFSWTKKFLGDSLWRRSQNGAGADTRLYQVQTPDGKYRWNRWALINLPNADATDLIDGTSDTNEEANIHDCPLCQNSVLLIHWIPAKTLVSYGT